MMLTILTFILLAMIVVMGRQLFTARPKMQPLKIKIDREQRSAKQQRRR